jgi:hypothetical protein
VETVDRGADHLPVGLAEAAGELVGERCLARGVGAVDRDPQRVRWPRRGERDKTAEQRVTCQMVADIAVAAQGLTQRWTTSACPASRC